MKQLSEYTSHIRHCSKKKQVYYKTCTAEGNLTKFSNFHPWEVRQETLVHIYFYHEKLLWHTRNLKKVTQNSFRLWTLSLPCTSRVDLDVVSPTFTTYSPESSAVTLAILSVWVVSTDLGLILSVASTGEPSLVHSAVRSGLVTLHSRVTSSPSWILVSASGNVNSTDSSKN